MVYLPPDRERSGGFTAVRRIFRIPLSHREAFLRVIDELPEWMRYLGKTDYDEFCRTVLEDFAAFQVSGRTDGDSRLQ